MEGTDATLLRAGSLCKGGTVAKMMRLDQDERYDIPTVGPDTLMHMAEAKLTCLALHAGLDAHTEPRGICARRRTRAHSRHRSGSLSIFISSGEASGDHYTARLAMKLRERGYSGDIWGMGGVESRKRWRPRRMERRTAAAARPHRSVLRDTLDTRAAPRNGGAHNRARARGRRRLRQPRLPHETDCEAARARLPRKNFLSLAADGLGVAQRTRERPSPRRRRMSAFIQI